MSRRTSTTLSIQVRLRVPPGSNTAEVLAYLRGAIVDQVVRDNTIPHQLEKPIAALDTDSMIVKLERKETVYL